MTGACSIASVTVAYNGASVLARHLDALKEQTRKLDEIIVVNNASTDGTARLLAVEHPEVTVLNLAENEGVGGGHAAGLQYAALRKKYNWIWLFDQDSVPAADALERLLGGLEYLADKGKNTAILAPVCAHSETKTPYPGLLWAGGRLIQRPVDRGGPITPVDLVVSSGSLVRREGVESVGLPRADFFMDFVDYEYCLRLKRKGFQISVVRDSHLDHVLGAPKKISYLGHTTYWTDHAPWRVYYMIRNEVFTIWQYYPGWNNKAFALHRAARYALSVLLFGKNKLACLGMMYRGWVDGRAGKLGIRRWQKPAIENAVVEAAK